MQAPANLLFWILFLAFVLLMLVLDLKVVHRQPRAAGVGEALVWTALWVGAAAGFALLLYFQAHAIVGTPRAENGRLTLEFVTAYLVEEALSIDNLFLFLLIFRHFRTPAPSQHAVLFWGILGAMVMRGAFIATGVTLLNHFQWIGYLFGAIVIYSGFALLFQGDGNQGDEKKNPATGFIARFARRHLRIADEYTDNSSGAVFTVRRNGVRYFTTLALVLIVVESTDLLFALDSIPAVLAVSRQPFIVFTSNVFAILGLRSLYFALAAAMNLFDRLHYGLAAVLLLIGVKMLGANFIRIPTLYAFAFTVAALAASMLWSVARRSPRKAE